jgi:hypothetical protein
LMEIIFPIYQHNRKFLPASRCQAPQRQKSSPSFA